MEEVEEGEMSKVIIRFSGQAAATEFEKYKDYRNEKDAYNACEKESSKIQQQ